MSIRDGGRATLVAHVIVWDERGEHLCKGHLTKQFFKLQTELPQGADCITLINAQVFQLRGPVVVIDDKAKTLVHPQCTMQSLERMSETCGGLGALGVGAEHAGFKVTAINEIQSSFCDQLRTEGRCNVIQGDICKMTTVIDLHEQGEGAAVFAFGFNCQPFSTLGDNKQGLDERSATLTYGLYAAYLLQMKIVILECVPNALQSKFVKVGIQHYLNHTDAFRSDEVLELSDLWPSYRRRWWCVLSHPAIGKITLCPLPKLQQTPTMSDLMPKFMEVTPEELDQLLLSDHEQSIFLSLSGGSHHKLVDINSTLSTALHSWGNQCIKCRCGCNREFSFQRLKSEGIHGALIYLHNSFPGKSLRHMCAREMAIFTAFPNQQNWVGDQRMLTSGVGQLASPIQSSWVCGIIRQHLKAIKFLPPDELSPKSSVASVCFATMELQQQWMGNNTTIEMDMFRESINELLTTKKTPNPIAFPTPSVEKQEIHAIPEREVEAGTSGEVGDTADHGTNSGSPKSVNKTKQVDPLSPEGFSQVLASRIGVIEQGLDTPNVGVDSKTGGIQAFASHPPSTLKRKRDEVDEDEVIPVIPQLSEVGGINAFVSQQDHNPKRTQEVETSPVVVPPAVVGGENDEKDTVPSESLYEQVNPVDLIQEKVVIYDAKVNQAWTLKAASGQTIGDFCQAHSALQNEPIKIVDILGNACSVDKAIDDQVYVINQNACHVPADLQERANTILFRPRWQSLLLQGCAVAVDEMQQYLQITAHELKCNFVAPVVVDTLLECGQFKHEWQQVVEQQSGACISAICHNNHWIPFVFEKNQNGLQINTTTDGKALWPLLSEDLSDNVHDSGGLVSKFQHDCGFQSIAWIITSVSNQAFIPMTVGDACKLRNLVWKQWYTSGYQSSVPNQIVLGGHSELETAVCAILKEHGVFMDRVQDRARLVIQKLGQQAVTGAMKTTRPWQSLKQMANMQTPPIRLIQDDEFQKVLQDRTQDGKPFKTQKKQLSFKKPRTDPVVFTPKDIHIPDGVFVQHDGEILGQIGVRQVHPQARGVVLLQEYEWTPFRGQKTISSEGLGFLVMAPFSHEVAQLGQEIRFPAQSTNTGEPILLSAVLIQHGQKEVGRCQPTHPQSIEQIETQTIKVLMYRDQCPIDWKEVCPKPVKALLNILECLQTCDKQSCQCNKSHPENNEVDPIIDLWQRDFVSLHFQKAKPDQAAIFTCFLRIAKTKLPVVIANSGQDGVYIEPRQQDGKKMDETFHTVWLNKQTFDEARAMQATAKMPVSLVRVTHRYGLRVEAKFGQELHQTLKPQSPFISTGEKTSFVIGPVPYGTTKKAMLKLFEQWGWVAQPIHPCGRSQDQKGLMWKVVAGCAPPHLVYTLAHGDVMVTRESIPATKEAIVPHVEASKHTITTQHQSSEGSKELSQLKSDPWASAATKLSSGPSRSQEITPAQIASVSAKIESNLLSKLSNSQDITMDSNEPRIAALEAKMVEMQKSQQQCVDQQQQVNMKMEALQNQVENQAVSFQTCLAEQMQEQMKRIESLLNKRKATE